MAPSLDRNDLAWIEMFLRKVVVHGDDQEHLFRVTDKVRSLIERGTSGTLGRSSERAVA